VFYLGFKVYPLHCVLATQARVCGPGRTGRTEPTRIRIRGIRATGLLIYSYTKNMQAAASIAISSVLVNILALI
jgi:hypothetical protein